LVGRPISVDAADELHGEAGDSQERLAAFPLRKSDMLLVPLGLPSMTHRRERRPEARLVQAISRAGRDCVEMQSAVEC
jgi:hypothetical protein